jgi:hypothetical protein
LAIDLKVFESEVTAFPVPEQHVEEFINHAFKRLSIRLISKEVRDQILVAEHAPEG